MFRLLCMIRSLWTSSWISFMTLSLLSLRRLVTSPTLLRSAVGFVVRSLSMLGIFAEDFLRVERSLRVFERYSMVVGGLYVPTMMTGLSFTFRVVLLVSHPLEITS